MRATAGHSRYAEERRKRELRPLLPTILEMQPLTLPSNVGNDAAECAPPNPNPTPACDNDSVEPTSASASLNKKDDPRTHTKLGQIAVIYILFATILFQLVKIGFCMYAIIVDIREDNKCVAEHCHRILYDRRSITIFLESLAFITLCVWNISVGCLLFSTYPSITVLALERSMKYFALAYVTQIFGIAVGLLLIKFNLTILLLAVGVVVLEGFALNVSFFYPDKYIQLADEENGPTTSTRNTLDTETLRTIVYNTNGYWIARPYCP